MTTKTDRTLVLEVRIAIVVQHLHIATVNSRWRSNPEDMARIPSRQRDQSRSRVIARQTKNIILLARCRLINASSPLGFFFLNEVQKEYSDQMLKHERRSSIFDSRFELGKLDDFECLRRFRFLKSDVRKIVSLLKWDDDEFLNARRGYRASGVEAFCIISRRLSTPCIWRDMEYEFGRSASVLCEIFYESIEQFYRQKGHLLEDFKADFITQRAAEYATKVYESGAPLDSCIGFVDGTNIFIARPAGEMQREAYNGHKKRHCVKFQALTLPDGLILHMYGPMEGCRHDLTMFRHSNLGGHLNEHMLISGRQFYVYADSAYQLQPYMMVGYRGNELSEQQRKFNMDMSKARITVEWTFKEIKKFFTHVDVPRKMSVSITPVGLWYFSCSILLNFRTCLYGSQTSRYFHCKPPSLEEYFSLPSSSGWSSSSSSTSEWDF